MVYDPHALGKIIRTIRKEKGLSQDVLSGLAGIGRMLLTMIETGTKAANIETLGKICSAMDIKLSELVTLYENDSDDPEEPS